MVQSAKIDYRAKFKEIGPGNGERFYPDWLEGFRYKEDLTQLWGAEK